VPVNVTASDSDGTTAPTGTAPNSPQHRNVAANQRVCSVQNVTAYITIGTECLAFVCDAANAVVGGECSAVVEWSGTRAPGGDTCASQLKLPAYGAEHRVT